MLTKILIFLGVVIGVFVVARLGASASLQRSIRKKKKPADRVEDLAPCPACGAYGPKTELCPCQSAAR